MNVDRINELISGNSIKNADAGKGIANYAMVTEQAINRAKETSGAGYVLDSVKANQSSPTYGNPKNEEKSLVEEIQTEEIATPELRRNQMAVLSNTMTEEDYRKMQEEGFAPGEIPSGTFVSVVDQIKANIAKTGGEVSGDLSAEELEEIVGSSVLAQQIAGKMQQQDLPLTEENLRDLQEVDNIFANLKTPEIEGQLYLVKNELPPTLENIYKAGFSVGTPRQESGIDFAAVQSQVEQIIENAGYQVSDEMLADAKALLERQIPMTEENFAYLQDLHTMVEQLAEDGAVANAVVNALKEGNRPQTAMLLQGYSMTDRAVETNRIIEETADEDIAYCIQNELVLSPENLKAAQSHRGENREDSMDLSEYQNNAKFISAKRILEETRLMMTTEANLTLLKKGIAIDTSELEKLVEELKGLENSYYENLISESGDVPTEEKVSLLSGTLDAIEVLKYAPATILQIGDAEETLDSLEERAAVQKANYEKANVEYEKLWTAPRADMGDRIQKAFRNVDDILKDMDLDTTDSNRRAVRILAYNQSEITEEHIQEIKFKDEQMQRLFANMTPRTTVELIRRGENPMDMKLEDLNRLAETVKSEIGDDGMERFEKYLYRLERSNEITREERDSYIGIYRLFAQIEKDDGAALGAAINQGMEPTLRNILLQLRSDKKSGMDYSVDDDFEGVTGKTTGARIDDQIQAAFQNFCVKDVAEHMRPSLFSEISGEQWLDMTPEELKNAMEELKQADAGIVDDAGEAEAFLADLKNVSNMAEDVYELLDRIEMPTTVENLMAAQQLMRNPGKGMSIIWKESLEDAREMLMERFGDAISAPTELAEALETLEQVAEKGMKDMIIEERDVSYVDLRAMQLATKQITLATKQTKEESFLIPVENADGTIGAIALKVVRGSDKKGMVDILFDPNSDSMGKVSASFEAKSGGINGLIVCENAQTGRLLSEQIPILAGYLSEETGEEISLSVASGKDAVLRQQKTAESEKAEAGAEVYEIQTRRLYGIAKTFISFMNEI